VTNKKQLKEGKCQYANVHFLARIKERKEPYELGNKTQVTLYTDIEGNGAKKYVNGIFTADADSIGYYVFNLHAHGEKSCSLYIAVNDTRIASLNLNGYQGGDLYSASTSAVYDLKEGDQVKVMNRFPNISCKLHQEVKNGNLFSGIMIRHNAC